MLTASPQEVVSDSVALIQAKNESEEVIERVSFENDFQKKYTDTRFIYESKASQKSAWERFRERMRRLYESIFGFKTSAETDKAIDITVYTLAILLTVGVVYLIVRALMNDEGKWILGRSSDKKLVAYDNLEESLLETNFQKLITNSEKKGDQRLTIRYYYLWLLKSLSEKGHIEWDIEKTNSDYAHEIKDSQLKKEFVYLSYLYDYIWYGEFEVDKLTYDKAKASFNKTIQGGK